MGLSVLQIDILEGTGCPMGDATLRGKRLFWAFVSATFLMAVVPSLTLIETARDYWRFLSGWQPGVLRRLNVRHVPHRDATPRPHPSDIRFVEFSLDAPKASSVALKGSFNLWDPRSLPMKKGGEGTWRAMVPLPAGNHPYLFVVDGTTVADPRSRASMRVGDLDASVRSVR